MVERDLPAGDQQAAGLPSVVVVPTIEIAGGDAYAAECWRYLVNTLHAAGVKCVPDPMLRPITKGVWPMIVDDVWTAFDFSDFMLVPGVQSDYRYWFRFQYLNSFIAHTNLSSFPPISFVDWPSWYSFTPSYSARGDQILHSQSYEFLKDSKTPRDVSLYQRRSQTRQTLLTTYGDDVWTAREHQIQFWRRAMDCLVSIHIPGSCINMLDRGQHQMFGLGVCTISPEIWTSVLGDRPEASVHYVAIRDDGRDLVDAIEWCRQHRQDCANIGRNARAFFLSHSTPRAIWRYVNRRITERPPLDRPILSHPDTLPMA